MDAERQVVTRHEDNTSKTQHHDEKTANLNKMLVDITRRADLLIQEKEELREDIRTLKSNNQILHQDNYLLINDKEMLIEKLLAAGEIINDLQSKIQVATNSQTSQSSPKFFSQ